MLLRSKGLVRSFGRAVANTRAFSPIALLRAPSAVIVRYHSIRTSDSPFEQYVSANISHSEREFEQHLLLLDSRYDIVSLSHLVGGLKDSSKMKRLQVAITFDDGYRDNAQVAAPMLDRFGMPATIYVVAHCMERRELPWYCVTFYAFKATKVSCFAEPMNRNSFDLSDSAMRTAARLEVNRICATMSWAERDSYMRKVLCALSVSSDTSDPGLMMSWSDIQGLARRGFEIGSHTLSHGNMAHVTADVADQEISESKRLIEARIGSSVTSFCYPNPILRPTYNTATRDLVAKAGFRSAVVPTPGLVSTNSDVLQLPRISAPRDVAEFGYVLESAFGLGRVRAQA
jgi:peptidoglycan/xylan/chitin deacetylase (PgdA/CDA1 family)